MSQIDLRRFPIYKDVEGWFYEHPHLIRNIGPFRTRRAAYLDRLVRYKVHGKLVGPREAKLVREIYEAKKANGTFKTMIGRTK